MKLVNLGKNVSLLHIHSTRQVLFSFGIPVAGYMKGEHFPFRNGRPFKTDMHFSDYTDKHIEDYLNSFKTEPLVMEQLKIERLLYDDEIRRTLEEC